MKATVEIFSSPTCPHCPSAVKRVKELSHKREDVVFIHHITATPEGSRRAEECEIRSVPTMIVTGENKEERIGFVGIPTEKGFNRMVDIALGRELWEEKTQKQKKVSEKKERKIEFNLFSKKIKFKL